MSMSRRRWAWLAVALVVGIALFDAYARQPADFAVTPLRLDPATRSAILLFHGSGGRDEPTLSALEARARELLGTGNGVTVRRYDWSPYSDARFRAAVNGDHVGRALGAELARLPALESVRFIAHSAGAYIPGAACEALRAAAPRPVRVDITYLDPIGFHGVLDAGWGVRNFGTCGDYVEAIINTDDPAPATNTPLENAWNLDVTDAAGKSAFAAGGHRWPVQYYLMNVTAGVLQPGAHHHATRPRGVVAVAE